MHWLYLIASVACLALAMIRTLPTLAVLFFLACALDHHCSYPRRATSNR